MSTALRTYYRGDELVGLRDGVANTTRYYHFDHQGTTQCLTDKTGAVTDRFASDAWGVEVKRTGSSINRQWYIGNWGYYRNSETNQLYIRRRYLRNAISRFTTRDPKSLENYEYAYSCNSPTTLVDISGLTWTFPGPITLNRSLGIISDYPSSGECGAVSWGVAWVAPRGSNGAIIQHVRSTCSKWECCSNKPLPCANAPVNFYEAWEVVNGQIAIPRILGRTYLPPYGPHDIFRQVTEGHWTYGSANITATVEFVPGYTFRSNGRWQYPGQPGHVGTGGPAPTSTVPPVSFSGAALTHAMTVSWNCCTLFNFQDKQSVSVNPPVTAVYKP